MSLNAIVYGLVTVASDYEGTGAVGTGDLVADLGHLAALPFFFGVVVNEMMTAAIRTGESILCVVAGFPMTLAEVRADHS